MKTRVMKRLTRSLLTQLNSPGSYRFSSITTTTIFPVLHHRSTVVFSPSSIYAPPKFLQITTFATTSEGIVDPANELSEDDNKNDVAADRKELPREFSRNVVVLTCESKAEGGKCVVYLVGTCHFSQRSSLEVEAVIRHVKPQVVFLELCASRKGALTQKLKMPTPEEMIEKWWKTHDMLRVIFCWYYAFLGEMLGVDPGSEFRVAFEEARKCEAKVVTGDRPLEITFRRMLGKLPLWHKLKVKFWCSIYLLALVFMRESSSKRFQTIVNDLDDDDQESDQNTFEQFPAVMETFVHERDQYMSSVLLRIAKEHTSVVAVVGRAHLLGIKKFWEQPVELKDLLQFPPEKPAFSSLKALAVAGAAIVSGFYLLRKK